MNENTNRKFVAFIDGIANQLGLKRPLNISIEWGEAAINESALRRLKGSKRLKLANLDGAMLTSKAIRASESSLQSSASKISEGGKANRVSNREI